KGMRSDDSCASRSSTHRLSCGLAECTMTTGGVLSVGAMISVHLSELERERASLRADMHPRDRLLRRWDLRLPGHDQRDPGSDGQAAKNERQPKGAPAGAVGERFAKCVEAHQEHPHEGKVASPAGGREDAAAGHHARAGDRPILLPPRLSPPQL